MGGWVGGWVDVLSTHRSCLPLSWHLTLLGGPFSEKEGYQCE